MSALAPLLEAFFCERLQQQRGASPNTVAAYADTFRLLLRFAEKRLGKAPSALLLTDLDAALVSAFLQYLEAERHNCARTRNARLAAIHSFFRYLAPREPAHAGQIQQVLAIPQKRFTRVLVVSLTPPEYEALLAAPDQSTWLGRRDHALLLVAIRTGLRVSELTGLRIEDVTLGRGAHVRCRGKGRKQRCVPLREGASVLSAWLEERGGQHNEPVFPSQRGGPLGRDGVEKLVRKYVAIAQCGCPSFARKRVSPHVMRHTAAVNLLRGGVHPAVIALSLGHESADTTQIYLDADLTLKEQALARTAPLPAKQRRYRPPDELMAFLTSL